MTTNTNKELSAPEEEIRTDLWPTMSISQLYRQQEMLLEKITKLQSMTPLGTGGPPTIQGLLHILQQAMTDLTLLIENKSSYKPRKTIDGQ